MFSMMKIDKQSLNPKFPGFILILSVLRGQLRTKCPCHTTFVHQSGTFLICFCGNTDVSLDGHHGLDGFILTIWTFSLCEVVKLKLMRYIPPHLNNRILKFPVLTFHLSGLSSFTSILISQPETSKYFW